MCGWVYVRSGEEGRSFFMLESYTIRDAPIFFVSARGRGQGADMLSTCFGIVLSYFPILRSIFPLVDVVFFSGSGRETG